MATIILTDADVHDLRNGASINAMADDSSEHVLDASEFTDGDFEALESGAELLIGENRISYPD